MEAKKLQAMTITEFNRLEMDEHITCELINGFFMMSPRPSVQHQAVMSALILEIGTFLKGRSCNVLTETEVELEDNVVVPDLFIYCDEEQLTKQRYIGGPKLVIEILSPSTAFNDLNQKLKLYERYGVEEYWIVAPNSMSITVHNFRAQAAVIYNAGEVLVSMVFENLRLELDGIFT